MHRVYLLLALLLVFTTSFRSINSTPPDEGFCQFLKTMLESAHDGFSSVKGEATERMITGTAKKFYISKVKPVSNRECYINDADSYPECECILTTDTKITEKLSADYESFKNQIKECLPTGWIFAEQDSSNNFYLKGTKYKKLVAREDVEGKKVAFHLYIYSSMIEKKRVVELKIEGIGKKD